MNQPTERHSVRVRVDADRREPLRRVWRYVGYDEPNYTYTPNGRSLLLKLGRMNDAPYFIRTHYMLCSGDSTGRPKWGSTNVYTEDADGSPVYTWDTIDRIFDTYVETGCIPFVEIGFMPQALTTAPPGVPYDTLLDGGWRYPPKDYNRWQGLVKALAEHCLKRYGLREVSRWYWELWNEPDIFYWEGTVEEYCRLYDHTVAGLLEVIPQAKMGGPATIGPAREKAGNFLRDFLEHCVRGTNALTGRRGTRLDFISFHTKGAGYKRDPSAPKQTPTIYALVNHVMKGLKIAGAFPELTGKEVILSECDPDGMAAYGKYDNPNLKFRNTQYYASYLACAVCKLIDLEDKDRRLRVDGMLTWAFQFENRQYFEGLRTLSTNGVDKPVLNVFRMLAKLGSVRLHLNSDGARDPMSKEGGDSPEVPPGISGIAAINGADEMQVFLSSHHDDWDVRTPTEVQVELSNLEAGRNYKVRRHMIDDVHSNAYAAWVKMGEPQSPSEDQLRALKHVGMLKMVEESSFVATDGHLRLTALLPTHSVCLLELTPDDPP
jgi:xylan 1,4-beta-xylosidase